MPVMKPLVLITGGAGFIGSHLADELLRAGYRVRALDNLSPQVHGPRRARPAYLSSDVELMVGDVRSPEDVRRALEGVSAVYHYAAMVGVGQSMYEIEAYASTNGVGTAVLLQALSAKPVERLIVASSMSIYGEGCYQGEGGARREGRGRSIEQLRTGDWEVRDADGQRLEPLPTPETKSPALASVYALSKFDQERMCLLVGTAYNIPTVALRFFNAYGPRQALSNPYTGVLAIFAARLLHDRPPLVFEDGRQRRDFVSVHDVARASRLALETEGSAFQVFNVGSGESKTVVEVAREMAAVVGKSHIQPTITGSYRVGDIRNCFADVGLAERVLGYVPTVRFADGLEELAGWLSGQVATDRAAEARAELVARGLSL